MLVLIGTGGLILWLANRQAVVNPSELDYLRAFMKSPQEIVLVGAWEAPGGCCLSAACHRVDGNRITVMLFRRPTVSKSRIFNLVVPTSGETPASLSVEDGTGHYTEVAVAKSGDVSSRGLNVVSQRHE